MVNFDCSGCGQNLEAPLKMTGMKILCPECHTLLQIPSPKEASEQRTLEQEKKATVPIMPQGGIPPDPKKRRVIIKRPDDKQG